MLFDSLPESVRDPLFVAIGLPVVAAQEARSLGHVLAHELDQRTAPARRRATVVSRRLTDLVPSFETPSPIENLNARIENQVKVVEERVNDLEARFDEVLDKLEGQLPDTARDVVSQARGAVTEARSQLRLLVNRAA